MLTDWRGDGSGGDLDQASEDLHFAAAVAVFGMVLRDSAYKGDASWDLIAELADRIGPSSTFGL